MRCLGFLFLFYAFSMPTIVGQSLYKDGFLLRSPFDTIHGQVKYLSYNKASQSCIFITPSGKEEHYLPNELFGYGIGTELLFIAKNITEEKVRFMEVVYQGTVILYAFRDINQRDCFYLEHPKSGAFKLLQQKTLRRQGKTITLKPFKEAIASMLPKSELVMDEIEQLSLKHNALSNFLQSYDERYAQFQGRTFQGFKKRWPPKIAPIAGAGISVLTINGYDQRATNHYFEAGIKFQKEVSRGTGRLFIDLDFLLRYEDIKSGTFHKEEFTTAETVLNNGLNINTLAANFNISGPVLYESEVMLERYNLVAPINLKYFFPAKKRVFSLNLGLTNQYVLSKNGSYYGSVSQNNTIRIEEFTAENSYRFRTGINIGIGLYLLGKNTWFVDVQHSPAWLDQGNLNFAYTGVRVGAFIGN